MENRIIERAMFLQKHYSKEIKDCVRQAINEVGDNKELLYLFRLYDISLEEYIQYIIKKTKGEL